MGMNEKIGQVVVVRMCYFMNLTTRRWSNNYSIGYTYIRVYFIYVIVGANRNWGGFIYDNPSSLIKCETTWD